MLSRARGQRLGLALGAAPVRLKLVVGLKLKVCAKSLGRGLDSWYRDALSGSEHLGLAGGSGTQVPENGLI